LLRKTQTLHLATVKLYYSRQTSSKGGARRAKIRSRLKLLRERFARASDRSPQLASTGNAETRYIKEFGNVEMRVKVIRVKFFYA
jgi:hypothetical protein